MSGCDPPPPVALPSSSCRQGREKRRAGVFGERFLYNLTGESPRAIESNDMKRLCHREHAKALVNQSSGLMRMLRNWTRLGELLNLPVSRLTLP